MSNFTQQFDKIAEQLDSLDYTPKSSDIVQTLLDSFKYKPSDWKILPGYTTQIHKPITNRGVNFNPGTCFLDVEITLQDRDHNGYTGYTTGNFNPQLTLRQKWKLRKAYLEFLKRRIVEQLDY